MNDNGLITRDNERVASFFKSLDRMLDGIEELVKNCKPTLNGERYLTDKDVAKNLKVSRRTLQDKIPYCQLGGKILYRESDILKMLEEGCHDAFRR